MFLELIFLHSFSELSFGDFSELIPIRILLIELSSVVRKQKQGKKCENNIEKCTPFRNVINNSQIIHRNIQNLRRKYKRYA